MFTDKNNTVILQKLRKLTHLFNKTLACLLILPKVWYSRNWNEAAIHSESCGYSLAIGGETLHEQEGAKSQREGY